MSTQPNINIEGLSIDEGVAAGQCPVAHFPSQPLPPGHPPTASHAASTLKAPTAPKCIFFRTTEDLQGETPPLSRAASQLRVDAANINPLAPGAGQSLDPATSLVLASRNSQLALVQSSQVSSMLAANYASHSPAFFQSSSIAIDEENDDEEDVAVTPPASPTSTEEAPPSYPDSLIATHKARIAALGIPSPCAFPITSMSTAGDQNQRSPLYVIGGDGRAIWTKELEVALSAGAVDAIVHCLKDVPTALPEGLVLGAILEREDPRDALVMKKGLPYKTLDDLPAGSVIGTSSVRRVAQLRRRYPNLVFSDVRGNLNTRLAKLDSPTGPYTALVLAAAGLIRLDFTTRITAYLEAPVLMHSVGQGSLAIEVRAPPPGADARTNREARILEMIRSIGCWRATFRAAAERALLRELEGGCSIPVGVETRFDDHEAVEGQRCEGEAQRLSEAAMRTTGKTRRSVEGHCIPAHALDADEDESFPTPASSSAPPMLQRLDTAHDVTAPHAPPHEEIKSILVPPTKPHPRCYPSDRASIPNSGATLTLKACVVSLDGARHCAYELTAHVRSLADAEALGKKVAVELATCRGARAILDEVERHRKLAEEADERRRREGRANRVREVAGAAAASVSADAEAKEEEVDEAQARRKLEEALRAAACGAGLANKAEEDVPFGLLGEETDRRGLPRDDGQAKAWEV